MSNKIPKLRSRNFDTHSLGLRKLEVTSATDLLLTGYVWGYAQNLREGLKKKFGIRFKGLVITSSNRKGYNDTVKGAAANSHHIFRRDKNGQIHVAFDCYGIGISLHELYTYAIKNCQGEIYLNKAQNIVHIAPVPQEDEHWIE